MFTKPAPDAKLQETIDNLILNLDTDTSSEQYSNQIDQLAKLYAIRDTQSPKRVSKDTLVIAAANLFGILAILEYEHARVVTSKALAFAGKLR